jgi:hypothetical protein
MRYIWTDAGDDPSWDVGDAYGIDGYFFPAFDPVTTIGLVTEARTRAKAQGIYVGHGWIAGTPAQYALAVRNYLKPFMTAIPTVRLQVNMEEHDSGLIVARLTELRRLLPKIGLSWSLEGMQGGWFTPSLVSALNLLSVRVVPEAFSGAEGRMQSITDTRALVADLTARGIPDARITPMIDAKYAGLINLWDGYAFTMGRLPWPPRNWETA